MERAYALLEVKAVEPSRRMISGIASTPELDRQGDIFHPSGATFRNPVPLLLHHNTEYPIGTAYLAVTAAGITFEATLPSVDEPGPLKTRIDDAWQCLKAGVMSGASIGFRILDGGVQYLKGGARQLVKTEICELSLVTIPANASATIRLVKSIAANRRTEGPIMKKTISEHIKNLETKHEAMGRRMDEIMQLAADQGRSTTPEEGTEHDDLGVQRKSIEADLERYREHEQLQIKAAVPVPAAPRPLISSISVTPNVEPGILFARYAIAKLAAKLDGVDAVLFAEKRWGTSTPQVALELKAAVNAGTTTDATWAKPLVNQAIVADFLPLLRAATIIGKIPGLKDVPFNVNVPAQTAGASVNWVGELKPKPVSAMAFATESIGFSKVAAIVALSQELVRFSNPKAEAIVRDSLVKDIAAFIDGQFTNPAVAAVAGINPASITNGAPTAAATTNPLADILGLINHFATNNIPVQGLTFLMSPTNALALSFRTNVDGSPEFPGITMEGGTYKGMTFITSNTLGTNVVALQPAYILFADDGGVTIDASTEASLQMDSAPASPVDATTVLVSMFQMNAVAIRAERYINWKRVGTNTVKYLTATAWPSPTGLASGNEPTAKSKA